MSTGPVDVSSIMEGAYVKKVPGLISDEPGMIQRASLTGALGGDPGGTTGLFLGVWNRDHKLPPVLARAWSCDAGSAPELLGWILKAHGHLITAAGFEAYDARRAARGMTARAMYELTTVLTGIATRAGITVTTRPPSLVKPWATDKRLKAAGVLDLTGKMPDARDASRHCIYAASKDCGLRDPLSRRTAS